MYNSVFNSAVRIFEILNRIVTSVFHYSIIQLFEIFEHLPSQFLISLAEWRRFFTLATTPSNQQNLLLTMVQVLYLIEVFILAHYYGPPSTETPTTTIVQCHKNSWIYLTSTYYWWLLRPAIMIRFDSKFQIIAQLFDSIRNEKKNTIRTALVFNFNFARSVWWHHHGQIFKSGTENLCFSVPLL